MFSETSIVAWWGAIIATLVLIWDIAKYFSDGARIRSNIKLYVSYPDGEIRAKETLEEGTQVTHYHDYVDIELANIGKMSTTLQNICLSSADLIHGKGEISLVGEAFIPHLGKKLPIVLHPGEVWSSRLKMDSFENITKFGKPEFLVTFSHLKKPLRITAPKAVNN